MSSLERAGKQASEHTFFLAARLVAYQQYHELTDQQLVDILGCSLENLARLRLCRVPETSEELAQVAARGNVDAQKLASVLREQ
jgi:hypothetical protein